MNYKSNYGVSQLTWEYINNIVLEENSYSAGALGPVIESNGKYYVTTLNPNVDIIDIPETLSKNPTDTNYYGNYYKPSVVLDKSLPVEDARKVIGNTKNSWIKAYESNYQTPYQLDSTQEELQEYFKEFESNTGKQIEVFEIKDGNHTISYRDNDGNLVNLEVDIKKNINKPSQLNNIKNQYQDLYKERDLQITENPDGTYNLVVDGKVVKTFKIDDYDLLSEKELFNLNEIKTSDKLNNDNKIVIEEYYQELFNDKNVVVKENEDGTYSLIADDKEIIFDKDSTLAEAVTKANSELNNGKPVQAIDSPEATRGLSELTNSEYSIYINTGDFERIVESHNMAKNIISDCSSGYNTGMFTEKLLSAYNELVGSEGNQDPVKRINKASELLNEVTTNIHYSLEAYKNIDHNLGIVINSIIEEIFTVNSYTNRHSVDGALSIEEKEEKIKKSIKFVEDTIRDLETQYNRNYTNDFGVPFSDTITRLLVGLADGLGLESGNTEANIDYYPDSDRYMNENIVRLDMNKLTNTINFIKEHDVVTKLSLYTKADALDSWTTSGMSELNDYILKNSIVNDYSTNEKNDYAERMFLLRYIRNQGEDKLDLEKKYNGYSPEYYLTDNLTGNSELDTKFLLTRKEIKNSIKELISKQMNEKMMITNYENNDVYYNAFELCDYYNSEGFKNAEQELMDNILTLRNAKYGYEQYLEIMPFLEGKNEKEYLDYLVKDYSKYDLSYSDIANRIKYLDQEEIALYFMLQGQGKTEEADKYLESMSDLIAQREGFELAATRIYEMNKNGDDIWDFISTSANGFTDGLEGFFRNVSNCFFSDGKRDAIDYRNMYMVSLLDTKNIYSDKLSDTYKSILKRNYNVMSGVGSMLIPALSRFVPYVGWAASPAMLAMSTFGGSVESAKQLGKSDVQSYLYGAFNTCSTMLLYKLLSGIPGIGNGQVPSSLMQFTSGINQAATRAVLSTYIDATLRSTILQEPVDFTHLPEQSFDSAINAMFISTIMQTGTKLSFKLADNLTVNLSKGEYSSYQDFLQDTEAQFKATPTGQRLLMLYRMNPEEYKNYRGHVSHGLLDRLVENVSKNDKSNIPWDLTSESENIIGMKMPMGSRFVFDPNSSNYYIINMSDGSGMNVPSTFISNHEPGPIQYTTPYAGLYSGTNISESSYTSDSVLPSIYKGSSEASNEVVTLETPTETPKEGTDVVVVATNDETNDVNIVQIQNVEQLVGDRIANTKNDVGPMMVFGTPKEGALMTNPEFVYRLTGLDQVDDIIETGFVRARDGGARQARIIKSGGMPRIWWSKGSEKGFINPDDRAVLVGPAETITDGKVGAASLGELTGIYLFNEVTGEYENHLDEIKEKHAELANPTTEESLPDDEHKTPVGSITPDEYYKEHTEVKTLDEIAPLLSKDDYSYWGHATPENENNDLFTKILDEGLRFPYNHSLDATANPIDKVKDVARLQDKLDSWDHRGSQHVFIVRLPSKYTNWQHSVVMDPKYFLPMAHETTDGNGRPTYAIDPEYILGYYDKNSHEFVMNRKFEETPTPEMDQKAQTIMDQLDKEFEENLEREENGNSQNATLETLTNVPEKDPFAIDSFDSEDDWAFDTSPVETLSNAQEPDPWDMSLDIPGGDDWGFDDEPKTPAVLRTPDEILEAYKKDGMDKYSMYDMESAMDPNEKYVYLRGAEKQLKNYLGLARTPEEQEVLSEILLNGGYKGVGFDSQLCTHDNRTTEEARRLSMATLYMTNPETFKTIMEDGVTMFHGTSSEILDKIMNNGLLSVEKIQELGEEVKTGEFGRFTQSGIDMNNSIRGKNFISFTDVFDLANSYANETEDGGFGIVVGTTPEDIKSSRRVNIGSSYTEIGVRDSLPTDKIKTLMVPKDKVEDVRKIVGNKNIKVLPLDDYEKKSFSFFDELHTSDEKFEELSEFIKNKPIETPDTKEETQPKESKYVITTPNGEKYSADAIGIKRDANGSDYDGVISAYDGVFTDEDIVKLESKTNAPRSVTIGDVSEAKELLNSIKLLAEEESFEEKCAIVGETVNEYFGDSELFFNRSYYLPTDEEVSQGKPQGKVSDIAHKQAAGSIERAMISQNLLKELGVDSTFKLTEYRSPKGAITTHGFNIVKDNGKYYIFDSSDPVLSYGIMSPIVCELPEEVALKMLDPLSKEGTSVSVTYHDSYEDVDSTYTYDAGWKDVYETTANGDQVTKMKNEEYRTNLMNGITQSLDSDNPAEKEAADRIFRSYALSNPSEATSYFKTYFNKLLPSTKEELLDKAISTSGYYMLINGIDLSPDGVFYQEDKDAVLRTYRKLLDKYETGEFNYRNMEKVAPYVFKELDPLFPVKADIEDASTRVARDQNYRYLLDYGKEIIDYTIENNIPIDRYVVYNLIGNEVRNNDSDALFRILDAGNYDASGYEAIKHLIRDNGEYIKKVALKHPEFLEGQTIKLFEDVEGFVDATKDIPGIKLYYEIGRYSEDIERLHDLYGDKVVFRPTNNSYIGEESYTYDEYKKKEAIIETYANSLRDTKDKNGNVKHLTPYEKYIASHIITTKFALYNLPDGSDVDLTRSVYEFIDKTEDRPICCVGYVSMDSEILERQEYPDGLLNMIHWGVNSKAERGAELDSDNHDRSLTYLVDPEYEIDGIYMSDPTWDRIHDNDLSREDVRKRNYSYLLETQEQLSYETWQFKDPLPNMHIETDDDMISIAKELGITDPDPVRTVRDKFNRPISDRNYILALCAINRFVDKNAVMPEVREVGPNGFTVEEYNRAALSAKMPQEMLIPEEDYQKSIKELADYYQTEYSVDGYEFNSVLKRMLMNKKEIDPHVNINYDDVDNVGNINISYHKLSDEDMAIIDNLPEEQWDYVAKKMLVKVSTYTSEIIETFDSNTPIIDAINKDVDYDQIVTLKQAQNHEKLMEILKSLEEPQDVPMSEEDIANKAIEDLNKIIGEKGIIIEDLDKLEGKFNPEEEGLAREYAEKIHSESLEHKETILPFVKKYEDSSLSGKSLEELFKERDEGTISNFRVLIGLDNQTKDVDSLVRKILTDYSHVNDGVTVDDVANNIHDGLRYTYLIDDTNYTKDTDNIINSLRERGYLVTAKNLWGNKAYQGVNAVVTDRVTGYSFEIQFHTLDSYNTKEILTHDYYSIFRSDSSTKEEKDLANTVQMYYQSKVNVPDGIIGHDFN